MIFGYFDESGETGDGFVVVAGLVGRQEDWKYFLKLWQKELDGRPSLHLAEMRLGSSKAAKRHGDLLHRLGSVPTRANLHAFAGSVRTGDYTDKTKGTIAEIGLAGYNVALHALIDAVLESKRLPKRERIDFTFEDQIQFAVPRAAAFHSFRQSEKYKICHGKSRVGDSAMAKCPLLGASDYLAYAILQQLIDPDSQKARITAPILEASKPIGHVDVTKENVDYLIEHVYADYGDEIPMMAREKRAFILNGLKKSLKNSAAL
jgi:hypothetical protein